MHWDAGDTYWRILVAAAADAFIFKRISLHLDIKMTIISDSEAEKKQSVIASSCVNWQKQKSVVHAE